METHITHDLFNIQRYIRPNAKPLDERAGAIKYFVDTFNLNPKRLAPKLAHLDLDMLYFLQSEVKDVIRRNGMVAGRKCFYWKIKVNVV